MRGDAAGPADEADAGPEGHAHRAGAIASLRVPNFAAFFAGQVVSNTGTWFQNLVISLIVLKDTGSGSALALVTVAQFAPIVLLAGVAGRVADSAPVRRVLMVTSVVAAVIASALAWAVWDESGLHLPLVLGLMAAGGCVHAFDRVAGQAFLIELVGPRLLGNGVVLHGMSNSAARSIGPGLAGAAYFALGAGPCLLVNAASFGAVLVSLLLVRPERLHRRVRRSEPARVIDGLREVRRSRPLATVLVVNAVVTLTSWSMNVIITAIVVLTFGGGSGALGAAHSLNAVGAVVGALLLARFMRLDARALAPALVVFAAVLFANAAAPSLLAFLVLAPVLGVGFAVYQGTVSAAAQHESPPHMIGRTMSLVTLGQQGVSPVGALLAGAIVDVSSGQVAMAVGATTCMACALAVRLLLGPRPR